MFKQNKRFQKGGAKKITPQDIPSANGDISTLFHAPTATAIQDQLIAQHQLNEELSKRKYVQADKSPVDYERRNRLNKQNAESEGLTTDSQGRVSTLFNPNSKGYNLVHNAGDVLANTAEVAGAVDGIGELKNLAEAGFQGLLKREVKGNSINPYVPGKKYPVGALTPEENIALENKLKEKNYEHLNWLLKDPEKNRDTVNSILHGGHDKTLGEKATLAGVSAASLAGASWLGAELFLEDPYKNAVNRKLNSKIFNTAFMNDPAMSKRDTVINLNNNNLSYARVNETGKGNTILGGDFIEDANNAVKPAGEWLSGSSTEFGDKHIPLSGVEDFYGVEDGKFKVGKSSDFNPKTLVVPNRFGSKKISNAGLTPEGDLRMYDENKQPIYHNVPKGGKMILYSPSSKNSSFISFEKPETGVNDINEFIKTNKDAQPIVLDNGRYRHYATSEKGLTEENFRNYYSADEFKEGTPGYNIIATPKKEKGGFSQLGYKKNSPHKNRDFNIINSPSITMQDVTHPVLGISDSGEQRLMMPGEEHEFSGNSVLELPIKQSGGTISDKLKIQDSRTQSSWGEPLSKPRTGEYDRNVIKNIALAAQRQGNDPYTAIAVGMQESGLGTYTTENAQNNWGQVRHDKWDKDPAMQEQIKKNPDLNPEAVAMNYVLNKSLSKKTGNEAVDIQDYNGYLLKPNNDIGAKKMYGIDLTKYPKGYDLKKDPRYGNAVIDLRDNVVKKNSELVDYVNNLTKPNDKLKRVSFVPDKNGYIAQLDGKPYGNQTFPDFASAKSFMTSNMDKFQQGGNVLPPVTVTGHKDKGTQEFFNDVKDYDFSTYQALTEMGQKYGFMKVDRNGSWLNRPHYNPFTNTTSFKNEVVNYRSVPSAVNKQFKMDADIDDYLSELPHKLQFDKAPVDSTLKWMKGLVNLKGYNSNYKEAGTLENDAHSVLEPQLKDEFQKRWEGVYDTDPEEQTLAKQRIKQDLSKKQQGGFQQLQKGQDLNYVPQFTNSILQAVATRVNNNRDQAYQQNNLTNPLNVIPKIDNTNPYENYGVQQFQDGGQVQDGEESLQDFQDEDFLFSNDEEPAKQEQESPVEEQTPEVQPQEEETTTIALDTSSFDDEEQQQGQEAFDKYDPGSYGAMPAGEGSKGNEGEAYNYLTQEKGIQPHIAAGIVGNLLAESGLNTGATGDSGLAKGIAQWHPDRQAGLMQFSRTTGKNPYDLKTQLDFVLHEAGQRGDLERIANTRTPSEAAYMFAKHYERPAKINPERMKYAEGVFNKYNKKS